MYIHFKTITIKKILKVLSKFSHLLWKDVENLSKLKTIALSAMAFEEINYFLLSGLLFGSKSSGIFSGFAIPPGISPGRPIFS